MATKEIRIATLMFLFCALSAATAFAVNRANSSAGDRNEVAIVAAATPKPSTTEAPSSTPSPSASPAVLGASVHGAASSRATASISSAAVAASPSPVSTPTPTPVVIVTSANFVFGPSYTVSGSNTVWYHGGQCDVIYSDGSTGVPLLATSNVAEYTGSSDQTECASFIGKRKDSIHNQVNL